MTNEEKLHLTVRQIELAKQGKTEEADKIRRQIPMRLGLEPIGNDYMPAYAGRFKKAGLNTLGFGLDQIEHSVHLPLPGIDFAEG